VKLPNAIAKPWLEIKRAYAGSALARGWQWWTGQLGELLPVRWRDALADRPVELDVRLREGAVEIVLPGEEEPSLVLDDQQDQVTRQAALARLMDRYPVPPRLSYRVPDTRLLHRRLTLPLAAQDNLRQVLGFELDRQTPFRPEQVYYDHRLVSRDLAARRLEVDLVLCPRGALDPELARIAQAGVQLDAVDGCQSDGREDGLNLLPAERRAARRNIRTRVNVALAAVSVALAVAVMHQSVANREAAREQLGAEVDKSKREARAVGDLRRSLADAVEGANFLADRRCEQPVVIALLNDLNKRLPDDTYLMRFSLTRGEIQLQGLSKEASKLVPVLQQSQAIEGPAVQGAITPDPRTGKEQFVISAKPRAPECQKNGDAQS